MAAYSASLRGASRIFIVDRVPERLAVAEKHIPGCEGVNFETVGDVVAEIVKRNAGKEVDRSVDCVGYQATGRGGEEVPNVVMEQCIRVTRATGGVGVPGLYVPSDPGAVDEEAGRGEMRLSFGKLFEKVRPSPFPPLPFFHQRPLVLTPHRASPSAPANATSSTTTATCAT